MKKEPQTPSVNPLPTQAEINAEKEKGVRHESIRNDLVLSENEQNMFTTFNLDDLKADLENNIQDNENFTVEEMS